MSGQNKVLIVGARLGGLRVDLDEVILNPMNAPQLAQMKENTREHLRRWIDAPDGFDAQWDNLIPEIRAKIVEARPSLRLEYAKALPPETPTDKAN